MGRSLRIFTCLYVLSLTVLLVAAAPASSDSFSARHRRDYDTAATFDHGLQHTDGSAFRRDPDILELMSVQDLAETDPELSSLNQLIKDTGATFYLEQTRDLTMFMPTNHAFQNAPFDVASLPWEAKWRILQYNTIPNNVIKLEDMEDDPVSYESWEGSKISVKPPKLSAVNGDYTINDEATIIGDPFAIENFNGISYKVDKLLIPPGFDASQYSGPRRKDDPESDVRVEESAPRTASAPQHVRDINAQHARWDDPLYLQNDHVGPVVRDSFKNRPGVGVIGDATSINSMQVGPKPSLRGGQLGVIKTLELGDSEEGDAPEGFGFAPNYVGWTRYDVVQGGIPADDEEDAESLVEASGSGFDPAVHIDITDISQDVRTENVEAEVTSAAETDEASVPPEESSNASLHDSEFHDVVGPVFTQGLTPGVLPAPGSVADPADLPSGMIRAQSLDGSPAGVSRFSPMSALRFSIAGF